MKFQDKFSLKNEEKNQIPFATNFVWHFKGNSNLVLILFFQFFMQFYPSKLF